jgi:superfamily II DNA or RNA helicase
MKDLNLTFKWPWRAYQARVLEAVEAHLVDRRLHVVAAPGAGKTTLGLEVFRRLGRPALVLSPTRGIRDQWIQRLQDFLPESEPFPPEWVSSRLEEPGILTSVTYQALHQDYRSEAESDEEAEAETEVPEKGDMERLVARMQQAGVGTLILDEAHHLRQEWWKALSALMERLPELTVVALTATPPYDVTGSEWKNYMTLCGPIDEEISVPELVKSGTLCPHQDFIWMVKPREGERQRLREYDGRVEAFTAQLLQDPVFMDIVTSHPWLGEEVPVDEVLGCPEEAFGLLVLMKALGPPCPKQLLSCLDVKVNELPDLNRRWWQVLLFSFLFAPHWQLTEEQEVYRDEMKKSLRGQALLHRRELRIDHSRPHRRSLSLSPAKLDAVLEIYREERALRGGDLRQVVLTDFIRDENLRQAVAEEAQLGAWPVFEHLVRTALPMEQSGMGLLTGRCAVVHRDRLARLEQLHGESLNTRPLPRFEAFVEVVTTGKPPTGDFTALLCEGGLQVLVGTRSLLGEGWDAPVINSLILCSYVGSFMLTNQMRGRAIRRDAQVPDKVASIWHVVAVDPDTASGWSDLEDLKRKFGTFVGLDAKGAQICNGLDRTRLPQSRHPITRLPVWDPEKVNAEMRSRLQNLEKIRADWRQAVETEGEQRVVPSVSTPTVEGPQTLLITRTLKAALLQIVEMMLVLFFQSLQGQYSNWRQLLWGLMLSTGIAFVCTLPRFIRLLVMMCRHLPVDGSIRQIALTLRDTLCATDLLPGNTNRFPVNCEQMKNGWFAVSLGNADFYEQSLFADCMNELLGPIENPRYLITRKAAVGARMDFHAVPSVLAKKKETATVFHRFWEKRLGNSELLYTRTPENRPQLLKARARAFSTAAAPKSERLDRWR